MPQRRTVLGALALSIVLSPVIGQVAEAEDDFTFKVVPVDTIMGPTVPTGDVEFVTPRVIMAPVVVEPTFAEPVTTTRIDLRPTVMEPVTVVTPQVIERHAIIPTVIVPTPEPVVEEQTVTVTTTPSTETIFLNAAARKPLFNIRIKNLKQQVDKGIANGWLTPAQAAEFQARADALMRQADEQLVAEADPSLSDPIERGVNQLNIDVSSAMQFRPMIGSGSQFQ